MNDWEYVRKDYKIKEHLGSGTYGAVYKVKHRAVPTPTHGGLQYA